MFKHMLITGSPGVGKTTLVQRLSRHLGGVPYTGFLTEEIREKGIRRGFEIMDFKGRRRVLSHTQIRSPCRVGKYGVDIRGFEDFLQEIDFLKPGIRLILVDEVGKMECCSELFIQTVRQVLESNKTLVATVALKGTGFIDEIKTRKDVKIFAVTPENRDKLFPVLIKSISEQLSSADR